MDFATLDDPGSQNLPNSVAVLVLGILSIPACVCCYGVISLAFGIIALVLANKDLVKYRLNPTAYDRSQYNNLSAGRVCAIIGICLGAIYLLLVLFAIVFSLSIMPDMPFDLNIRD